MIVQKQQIYIYQLTFQFSENKKKCFSIKNYIYSKLKKANILKEFWDLMKTSFSWLHVVIC
jgi:hypothetical protein